MTNCTEPSLLTRHNTQECLEIPCTTGRAILYSAPSPTKKTDNEDSVAIIPISETQTVFVVADGVGGYANGADASLATINILTDKLSLYPTTQHTIIDVICLAIQYASKQIEEHYPNAATTIAVVLLDQKTIRVLHAGDSEVLVSGQRGKIKLRIVPHSPVGYAVASGLLPEDLAMFHKKRSLISNAVGLDDLKIEQGRPLTLCRYDTLLLATDGVFDNLFTWEIVKAIAHGDLMVCAQKLVQMTNQRMHSIAPNQPHKPDDMSFILFRLN